jgi:RimJ/RimL family protein N-acetyltransferase
VIRFEPTTNLELVRRIITTPQVYRHLTDDACPPAEEFQPVNHPSVQYVLAFNDAELLGMWMAVRTNAVTVEVHTCLLPSAWGERALAAARAFSAWIWANTPCRRITTTVPAYNRLALRFAERAGMTQFGVNPASFLKSGTLHDQILLGLSRPEGE